MRFLTNTKSVFLHLFVLILGLTLLQACGSDPYQRNQVVYDPPAPFDLTQADTSYNTDDGLEIYILEQGSGSFEVISRDVISAYYTRRTLDGRVLSSTYTTQSTTPGLLPNLTPVTKSYNGQPQSPLIEGFRLGLLGMKEGEKRTIIIPPSLAYGDAPEGSSNYELRDDTLKIDVELERIY